MIFLILNHSNNLPLFRCGLSGQNSKWYLLDLQVLKNVWQRVCWCAVCCHPCSCTSLFPDDRQRDWVAAFLGRITSNCTLPYNNCIVLGHPHVCLCVPCQNQRPSIAIGDQTSQKCTISSNFHFVRTVHVLSLPTIYLLQRAFFLGEISMTSWGISAETADREGLPSLDCISHSTVHFCKWGAMGYFWMLGSDAIDAWIILWWW